MEKCCIKKKKVCTRLSQRSKVRFFLNYEFKKRVKEFPENLLVQCGIQS